MKVQIGLPILSDDMLTAMHQTVAAYEYLIRDPLAHVAKWRLYGHARGCRLCVAAGVVGYATVLDCSVCPLGPGLGDCVKTGVLFDTAMILRNTISAALDRLDRGEGFDGSDIPRLLSIAALNRLTALVPRLTRFEQWSESHMIGELVNTLRAELAQKGML